MVSFTSSEKQRFYCCGFGPDITNNIGWLSDTWMLDSNNTWHWIAGSMLANSPGNYTGSQQSPGSRSGTILIETDRADIFALFGGFGYGAYVDKRGKLGDLWLFNTTERRWYYLAGPLTVNTTGNYGQQGVSSASNWPGSRVGMAYWKSASPGVTYLFGGWGFGTAPMQPGPLNDVWRVEIQVQCATAGCLDASAIWTWISGPQTVHYPANASLPSGRYGSGFWSTPSGDAYLFGGWGILPSGKDAGDLGDFWHWSAAASQWNLLNAGNTTTTTTTTTDSVTSPAYPKPRYTPMTWLWPGQNDVLAMFGGSAWNDLWVYDISTKQWLLIGGCATEQNQYGSYGELGVPSPSNWPSGRYGSAFWWNGDEHDEITFFGGFGLSVPVAGNTTNDLSDTWVLQLGSFQRSEGKGRELE